MLHDLRAALRGLWRDRAYTFFSVLALGLGLNGSLLVLSRTFFLRSAPVRQASSLLELHDLRWKQGAESSGSTVVFEAVRGLPEVSAVGLATKPRPRAWPVGEGLEEVQVAQASDGYLEVCGLLPFLGRGFAPGETGLAKPPAIALVSHRFWTTRLGGRPEVLSRPLKLNGRDHTVIGVLPPGFEGHRFSQDFEVLVPREAWPYPATSPVRDGGDVLLRLKPGATQAQLQARLALAPGHPDLRPTLRGYSPLAPQLRSKLGRGLAGLHAASLLILGIGLANVLALQVARLHRRRPELALRTALGARGGSLFRLVLLENLALAFLAGLAALALALLSTPFLQALQALLPYPPKVHLAFGLWAALATLVLSLLFGGLLAVLVHVQVRRLDLDSPLKEASQRATGTRIRGLLVGIQAAMALVLLATASLCLKDLRRQMAIPLGYELEGRYLAQLKPEKAGRKTAELAPHLAPLLERTRALPGVRGAATGDGLPLGGLSVMSGTRTAYYMTGQAEALALLGVRPVQGRALEAADEDHGRILVTEGYARERWPGESPLGQKISYPWAKAEVVGVLPDLRLEGPTGNLDPAVYIPTRRASDLAEEPHQSLLVHATGSPRTVKAQLRGVLQGELKGTPFTLDSLEELRDKELAQPRQLLFLSSILGALALLLSLCGLYGLAAHLAASRRRELGIRVVLGAGPGRILALLARGSLLPLVPGLGAGALLAWATSRLLLPPSPGFPSLDAPVLMTSALFLATAAALACLFPALRAARVAPAEALRSE